MTENSYLCKGILCDISNALAQIGTWAKYPPGTIEWNTFGKSLCSNPEGVARGEMPLYNPEKQGTISEEIVIALAEVFNELTNTLD